MFLGEPVDVARYDKQKYPFLEKLTDQQLGFFWRPEEVNCIKDADDFKKLTPHEQHIFTSNLKRQILLDSVQGRAPTAAFSPICSLPELETWILTWAFSESIHSRSYTHIIRNIYPDPSLIFDTMLDIKEIVDCAADISAQYDELIKLIQLWEIPTELDGNVDMEHGVSYKDYKRPGPEVEGFSRTYYDNCDRAKRQMELALKTALYKCFMSVNIIEGVRFYVSFACSWAFAELKTMEGNAKIIKLICRDENLHLAGTQQILAKLPTDDPDFVTIKEETKDACIEMFRQAAEQEKTWARYLFQGGSMIGLNEKLLCDYVEWITNKRMVAVGLPPLYKVGPGGASNPLPWTQNWISAASTQVAPQETEITSYVGGQVKLDVDKNTFKGMKL